MSSFILRPTRTLDIITIVILKKGTVNLKIIISSSMSAHLSQLWRKSLKVWSDYATQKHVAGREVENVKNSSKWVRLLLVTGRIQSTKNGYWGIYLPVSTLPTTLDSSLPEQDGLCVIICLSVCVFVLIIAHFILCWRHFQGAVFKSHCTVHNCNKSFLF